MVRELQGSTCNSKSLDYSIIGFIKKKKRSTRCFKNLLKSLYNIVSKKKKNLYNIIYAFQVQLDRQN